jgi:hypothetical protein
VRTLVALWLALCVGTAGAQGRGAPADPFPFGGENLRVSVLTFGPGDEVFERFGHNALRITDVTTGMDLAYNWGMFSFEDPDFLVRFFTGDTRYWVEAFPGSWLIEAYIARDREVHEQVLALTVEQRTALAALVTRNALPENKYYRYDYFLDNCSTRVRDALDAVLGGSLQRRFSVLPTQWTFRSESIRLLSPAGLAQAGGDIALGPPADVPITAWQSMFVPMRLRDYLRDVTVPGADGAPVPIVIREELIYKAKRPPEPAERRGLTIGAWGPILGAWMLLLAPLSALARRRTRVPAAIMASVWYGLTGLVGLVLVVMWFGSGHQFWYRNLNLLLVSPIGLLAAVPVALAILRGAASPLARWLVLVILAQCALALLLVLVGPQRLGGPMLLTLPAHLGLAVAFWQHLRIADAPSRPDPAAESR